MTGQQQMTGQQLATSAVRTVLGAALSSALCAGLCAGLCLIAALPLAVHAQPADAAKDVIFPDPPPKAPLAADLIEYFSVPDSRARYWLDLASLAAGDGDTIRFTLVIESEGGFKNVRHEAFRCVQSERKLLAFGRPDNTWALAANPAWQPLRVGSNVNLGYRELFRALCFGGVNANAAQVSERVKTGLKQGNY